MAEADSSAHRGGRPQDEEFHPTYKPYIALVPESDIVAVLEAQKGEVMRLAASVAPGRETFRYAEGKWTVRAVLGHVTDVERVFGFRAFSISRGEQASLPGFDENAYVAASDYDNRALRELAEDFSSVRESNLRELRALDKRAFDRRGTANGKSVSVRALAFMMAGHLRHHVGLLHSRYGLQVS